MRITIAEKADLQPILLLQYEAYKSEAQIYDDDRIPPLTQTLEDLVEESSSHTILKAVLGDGQIIGSARAREGNGTCYIGKIIVHPDYQNRGIGTALIRELERVFAHCARIELFTGHLSERNLYLYQKLGYNIFRTEPIHERLNLVYLEKRIPQDEKNVLLASFQEWIAFLSKHRDRDEQLWNQPVAPGKWPLRAVVSHMMLWDKYFYEHAIGKIHTREPLTLRHTDYDEFNRAAQLFSEQTRISRLMEQAVYYREKIIAVIRALPDDLYDKEYVDADGQPFFVAQYLKDFIPHDRHHIAEMEERLQ
ncbi:GNAT family N-acetyltransferase [Paenibacillus ihumii]|uniref:GNAT family N-acetyltransferase n=1 Tax=Paenibacillus ihumii TaxID=687436 RepID=UPI0009FA6EF8|nr:GNAT family N-acetyltransferase [Paenibacillus ihumii]